MKLTRRRLLSAAAAAGGAAALRRLALPLPAVQAAAHAAPGTARVALVKTSGHRDGVLRALRLLPPLSLRDRSVVIKPNLNSSDPFPGSTHNETLQTLLELCRAAGARDIVVADRSGMGNTATVIRQKGIDTLAGSLGARVVALDALPPTQWLPKTIPGGHWRRGVLYPALLERADVLIQTCCLKTHRFGGHFTLSLKNSVGMVAKVGPDGYDYMQELHGSPLQRTLIAEINVLYRPAVVVLDGIEAFVEGGPEVGRLARPEVVLAGSDRVAIDAVGVALLRIHGATGPVARGPIFAQDQIRRAVELGLGAPSPEAIELVTDSAEGEAVIRAVRTELGRA
ncbi:MAG: DUF362 domain-containing protein [Armatimonadota bacterium]|nr:DUF362 domain-containing protein [Armatimonadota bacterium]MDR7450917.1 DUF362 domain-containing protein [Armatimonadota bacterium]MDR7465839.1 DUF362 domain-containing protein [Armatimonadota bacterium]MDR7493747.1 DUF362 domain-containing protein [Armatimonadota bacterium]MDR7498353.1 DUF362 domain-containing protein [Armatimonadota bacterium]